MRRSSLLRGAVWSVALAKFFALLAFPGFFLKKASEARVELEAVGLLNALSDTFLVLKLVIKPFQIVGFSTPMSISLTMLLATLWFQLLVCARAEDAFSRRGRPAQKVLILFVLFAPAVNFFSVVALRDALIFVLVALSVSAIFSRSWAVNSSGSILLLITSVATFLLRPETAVILVGVALITLCGKTALRLVLALLFCPVLLIALAYASSITASYAFNMDIADPFTMIDQIRESRFQRQFRADGGGSAIMSMSEWGALGPIQKYGAQVIATIFMPLSLSSVNYILVATDSLSLMIAVSLIIFATKGVPARGLKVLAITCSLLFVVLLLAPFLVNFGNGFRIRLMVWAVVAGVALALLEVARLGARKRNWTAEIT